MWKERHFENNTVSHTVNESNPLLSESSNKSHTQFCFKVLAIIGVLILSLISIGLLFANNPFNRTPQITHIEKSTIPYVYFIATSIAHYTQHII